MWVRFNNLEAPGQNVKFNKQGKEYFFEDGKEYTMSHELIEHLNGLSIPKYEFRDDTKTGKVESKIVGRIHRFNCSPVFKKGKMVEGPKEKKELAKA